GGGRGGWGWGGGAGPGGAERLGPRGGRARLYAEQRQQTDDERGVDGKDRDARPHVAGQPENARAHERRERSGDDDVRDDVASRAQGDDHRDQDGRDERRFDDRLGRDGDDHAVGAEA